MSTPEERCRMERELVEVLRLVPDRSEQMRIRADATRLARTAFHLKGEDAELNRTPKRASLGSRSSLNVKTRSTGGTTLTRARPAADVPLQTRSE
jgi:hypothetical protein